MPKYLLIMLFALTSHAWADAPSKPEPIKDVIKAEKPLGTGTLSKLWFKGYDAALWTDASDWSLDSTYALALEYGMSFSTDELVERSIKEINRVHSLSQDEQNTYSDKLNSVFRDVSKNDVITALHEPSKGVTFYYNGSKTGVISDKTFAKRFMSIWMGSKTSEPELRQALLGK